MIEHLIPIVKKVCEFQLNHYQTSGLEFVTKAGPTDFVSEVDIQSQQMIVDEIEQLFPQAGILGEEACQKNVFSSELLFVIDPLDGTSNFRSKLDSWAISIGLLKDGFVHEGIIAIPLMEQIVCSNQMLNYPSYQFNSTDQLYLFGTDRLLDHQRFPFKNLKKRLLGATVPTIYYCFKEAFQNRPGLDFALLGTSKLWDIAGISACLKAIGGSLLNLNGLELLEENLLEKYANANQTITKSFPIIASANPQIARVVLQAMQDEHGSAFNQQQSDAPPSASNF